MINLCIFSSHRLRNSLKSFCCLSCSFSRSSHSFSHLSHSFLTFYLAVVHVLLKFLADTLYITGHLRQNMERVHEKPLFTHFIMSLFILFILYVPVCSDVVVRRRFGWYHWTIPFHGEGLFFFFLTCRCSTEKKREYSCDFDFHKS